MKIKQIGNDYLGALGYRVYRTGKCSWDLPGQLERTAGMEAA